MSIIALCFVMGLESRTHMETLKEREAHLSSRGLSNVLKTPQSASPLEIFCFDLLKLQLHTNSRVK